MSSTASTLSALLLAAATVMGCQALAPRDKKTVLVLSAPGGIVLPDHETLRRLMDDFEVVFDGPVILNDVDVEVSRDCACSPEGK